jgi:hypothetical protein
MMIPRRWQDVDLSRFALEPAVDHAVIELGSCYDGSDLAVINCSGVICVHIQSALGPNRSQLPVLVGEVSVEVLAGAALDEFLKSHAYGFTFCDGRRTPNELVQCYVVKIIGGEIEATMITMECTVHEPTPDAPPSSPRG